MSINNEGVSLKKDAIISKSISLLLVIILLSIAVPSNTPAVVSQTTNFSTSQNTTRDYWPTDGWRNSTPQEHGMNNETLYDMLDIIDTV